MFYNFVNLFQICFKSVQISTNWCKDFPRTRRTLNNLQHLVFGVFFYFCCESLFVVAIRIRPSRLSFVVQFGLVCGLWFVVIEENVSKSTRALTTIKRSIFPHLHLSNSTFSFFPFLSRLLHTTHSTHKQKNSIQ